MKPTLTTALIAAGFGVRLVMVTVGLASVMDIDAVFEPVRLARSVAFTVIVKALLASPPVL